jgi:hypothetical protein
MDKMPENISTAASDKLRDALCRRWEALRQDRSSWMAHWREISECLLPRSGRFLVTDRNRGDKRHGMILDNTGTRALRVLAAGMMEGMTSPARPWFRLTTSDPGLDEADDVKTWLAEVTRIMLMVFARSNTYRALHSGYEELGAFATWASIIVPDTRNVIHHHALTIGEYALAQDYAGKIDTLYREFEVTVAQAVAEFGHTNVSERIRNQYDRGDVDSPVRLLHAIEPRRERDTNRRDALNMPFRSVYFEPGGQNGRVLRESGFRRFPALCPRWAVTSGDVYGNGPGMEALGDIRQLQQEQLRKSQGIDYQTNPPLQIPTALKNQTLDTLPGGVSYVDQAGQGGGIRTAFEVQLNLQYLLADIQDVRERIKGSFYADIFMMMANSTNQGMTATEVAERHEEKMLMMGPVIERLSNEIFYPLIDMTFERMVEAKIVPPAPAELQGRELNVEFVSMLAQAQRAISTNSVDRFVNSLGTIAQMKPEVTDKLDPDKWADAYADMLGVDPEMIVPSAQVALIRQQRQQAAAAQQAAQAAQQHAAAANSLAQAGNAMQGPTQ